MGVGRLVRRLRRRGGWRQCDLARKAGVHRSTVSLIERGQCWRITLATLRDVLAALEVRLELRPLWRGPQLDRLLDEDHARLAAAWKERLERWGWTVWVEASFSRYGERGRIDLLAWHPGLRVLAVVEIKTDLADAQDALGSLDVKVRNAPYVAAARGWPSPAVVVPVLIFGEDRTVRRRVVRVNALFDRFSLRGRAAGSWLRRPAGAPAGLLMFSDLTPAGVGRVRRGGRERVRARRVPASVAAAITEPHARSRPA